jgi:hypothetical protein
MYHLADVCMLIIALTFFHSTMGFYDVCSLKNNLLCESQIVWLKVSDKSENNIILCCETRFDKNIILNDIVIKESTLVSLPDVVKCSNFFDREEFMLKVVSYEETCYKERDTDYCSCISKDSGYRKQKRCSMYFPNEVCYEGLCSYVFSIKSSAIGCKLKKLIYNKPNTFKSDSTSIAHSTNCMNKECKFNDKSISINNLTGIVYEIIEKVSYETMFDYNKLIINCSLIMLTILIYKLLIKTIVIEVTTCRTCNEKIIRHIRHKCEADFRSSLEAHIESKRLVQLSWFTFLTFLMLLVEVNTTELCDKHCFLMNSLKNYDDTFTLNPIYSDMRLFVDFKASDYNYRLNNIKWNMKASDSECVKYNVGREWTYNYKRNSSTGICEGDACYAVSGNVMFKIDFDTFETKRVGYNCFQLPGIRDFHCTNNIRLDTDSIMCKHIIKDFNKTEIIERTKYKVSHITKKWIYVTPKGFFTTSYGKTTCSYVKKAQESIFNPDYDPFESSKLCSKEGVLIEKESTKGEQLGINKNGVYYRELINVNSSLICKVKGQRSQNCRFTYKINSFNMTEIIPLCENNFILIVNNTRTILPCNFGSIPLLDRNTKYNICGHNVRTDLKNTNYVCNCTGPLVVDELLTLNVKNKYEKPKLSIRISRFVFYGLLVLFMIVSWCKYVINGINVKSIPRKIVDVTMSFENEMNHSERLTWGLNRISVENILKKTKTNVLLSKINTKNKIIKAKKSVKTKFLNSLNNLVNPTKVEQSVVEIDFDNPDVVVDHYDYIDDFDSSDSDENACMKYLEGEYEIPKQSDYINDMRVSQ